MKRALLTTLICGIAISLFANLEQGLNLSPLILGLSISSGNYKMFKINPIAGILIFISLSYLVYILSICLTFGLTEFYDLIIDWFDFPIFKLNTNLLILFSGTIGAIVLYLLFSLFLKEQNKLFGGILILLFSILIPLTVWVVSGDDDYSNNEDFLVYIISYMIYMSLGFGIAINQLEIKKQLRTTIRQN
jgi:hypothetical protein